MKAASVLVIASHPDDEVLGCGGTIARLAADGSAVEILILGEGATSRCDQRSQADIHEVERLELDSTRAAALLGARHVHHMRFPDNQLDQVPLLEIVKSIEGRVHEIRPQVVFTQHGGDLNIDHAITFRATLIATRPLLGRGVHALLAYQVPSSTEWAFSKFSPPFHPNYFVDISSTLSLKIRALDEYRTEARSFPHPRSPEALHALATTWGSTVGLSAAEAFEQVWRIM